MLCPIPVQHVGDPKALVLSWLWSLHANSQAIEASDLLLYLRYLLYTKWYTKAKNRLISQPITIVVETDWAAKRNTCQWSMIGIYDKFCYCVSMDGNA